VAKWRRLSYPFLYLQKRDRIISQNAYSNRPNCLRYCAVAEADSDNCAMSSHVNYATTGCCRRVSSPSNNVKQLLDLDALCVVEMEMEMTSLNNDDTSCIPTTSINDRIGGDEVSGEMTPRTGAVEHVSCIVTPKSLTGFVAESSGMVYGSQHSTSVSALNHDHVTCERILRPSFHYRHEYDD